MPFDDHIFVSTGERRLSVRVAGKGRPLLFLHGYPLDLRLWNQVIPLLSDQFLCIAPDFRGFGKNSEERLSFGLKDLAKDCSILLESLQVRQPAVVCGLSMGGYVAMEFVEHAPDRVCGAVLTNTRCTADDTKGKDARRQVAQTALAEGVDAAVGSMLDKLFDPIAKMKLPESVDLVKQMMSDTRPSTVAWAQLAMAQRRDFSDSLEHWRIPVACVGGASDPICPPDVVEHMHCRLKTSQLHILPESAHLSPLESPSRFTEIVKQLTDATR